MASPYALPSSAATHAHSHHIHTHSHSQSQTSLNSWKSSMSNSGLHSHPEDDHEHGHSRSHSRSHSHGRASSQASNTSALMARDKLIPAALDTMDGWTQERTAGGKSVITPGPDTVTMPYSPPVKHDDHHDHGHDHIHDHSHSHDHDHGHGHDHDHGHEHRHDDHTHDHNNQRSLFTAMLLPHTAQFPILHAVMTEKDSRRIFYFMAYVSHSEQRFRKLANSWV